METEKTYDPNLRKAMAEIKEVCKKYECGGAIAIANQRFGEFTFIFPKWSLAQWIDEPGKGIRLKAKSGVTSHEDLESTMHLLLTVRDVCKHYHDAITDIEARVREQVDMTHEDAMNRVTNDDR